MKNKNIKTISMKTKFFIRNTFLFYLLGFLLLGITGHGKAQTGSNNLTKEISVNMQESCYLLLCKTNDNNEKLSSEHYVIGEITVTDKNQGTCRLFVSTYYSQASGSKNISDDCGNREFVLVKYQGVTYVALNVTDAYSVSFSGSVSNEALLLVKEENLAGLTQSGSKSGTGDLWQSLGNNIYSTNIGNVGIGTASPDNSQGWNKILDIYSASNAKLLVRSINVKTGVFSHESWNGTVGRIGTESSHDLRLMVGYGTDVMTLKTTGNVGIGTTNPAAKLHVTGTVYLSSAISIGRSGGQFDEIGYNIGFTGTNDTYTYRLTNPAASIRMGLYGAIEFRTAPSGTAGASLTLTERMKILQNGNVGIGTTSPTHKLDVRGVIRANEVIVNTAGADFVFADDYRLPSLKEVEQFIIENKHLPDIAPADSMIQNGIGVSEMQIQLLQKIEELTLYVIEQEKRINELVDNNQKQNDLYIRQQDEIDHLKSK